MSQCTRFVRTDHGDSSHRLAGVHLSYQIVGREHTAHIQGQAERYAHGQPFGDGYYNQSNSHHEIFEGPFENRKPLVPAVQRTEIKVQQYIFYKEDKEGKSGNGKTDFTDQVRELGQLYIQRGRFQIFFGALACYLADFCGISHVQYAHGAVSVHHCCSAHH